MRSKMCIDKLELNFLDFFWVFMYFRNKFSEEKNTSKHWLNLVELSVVLILKQTHFLYFRGSLFESLKGSWLDFKKHYLCSVMLVCLCTNDKMCYASLMFNSWGTYQWNRSCQKQVCSYSYKMVKLFGKYLSWSLRAVWKNP